MFLLLLCISSLEKDCKKMSLEDLVKKSYFFWKNLINPTKSIPRRLLVEEQTYASNTAICYTILSLFFSFFWSSRDKTSSVIVRSDFLFIESKSSTTLHISQTEAAY